MKATALPAWRSKPRRNAVAAQSPPRIRKFLATGAERVTTPTPLVTPTCRTGKVAVDLRGCQARCSWSTTISEAFLTMMALLERSHADVTVAEGGIMMPITGGYATTGSIRPIERFALPPTLAIIAKVAPGERRRCRDAGSTNFIPRPVDAGGPLSALEPWLRASVQAKA